MLRQWNLLLVTILLSIVVFNKVQAYYDDDDVDDDSDYKNDYYDGHYEGDGCTEDEDLQDLEDLEEIAGLLTSKGITSNKISANGISPMAGQGLILPVVPSDTCSTSWFSNDVYRQFNAIIFGDFLSNGGSSGPLAVKGDFTVLQYYVSAFSGSNTMCLLHDSVRSYGLVVGGFTSASASVNQNLLINLGNVLINGKSDSTIIQTHGDECIIKDKEGTGLVDFDALEVETNEYNNLYRDHPPTLQLSDDGSLKRLTNSDQSIEYITFNSCNDKSACAKIWDGQMSTADNILFGQGVWSGIQGDIKPDSSKTYVFNIPVIENTNITLTTNYSSTGFNVCKLVYNFYPVKQGTGEYNPTGAFTLVRENGGYVSGLILAPRGRIIENNTRGLFMGQIFAMSYSVANVTEGSGIHAYFEGGGMCQYFDGCNPLAPPPPPPPPPSCNATETTVTAKTTVTQGSITTVTQDITVTEGSETITQLSTVTNSGDVTQTVTSLVTETVYHTHNEDCDEEEEEYYKDSYEKKWNHKEHDDEDDCDEYHYY